MQTQAYHAVWSYQRAAVQRETIQVRPAQLRAPPLPLSVSASVSFLVVQEELKKSLYFIFGQYGNIVEINCNNTYKMRGQAWIVFDSINSGQRAQSAATTAAAARVQRAGE
jgi:hypothetical protein